MFLRSGFAEFRWAFICVRLQPIGVFRAQAARPTYAEFAMTGSTLVSTSSSGSSIDLNLSGKTSPCEDLSDLFERFLPSRPRLMSGPDDVLKELHNELQHLFLALFPSPGRVVSAGDVVSSRFRPPSHRLRPAFRFLRLRAIILSVDHRLKVEIYGSTAQQLYLPTSDLDVAVDCPYGFPDLTLLAQLLRGYGLYANVTVIGKSAYPILKLVETGTNLSIDVGFNVRHSLTAVTWVKEVRSLRYLEQLVFITKHYLHHKGLNVPYNGGLTSYALIVMVAHFLKRFDLQSIDPSLQEYPLGVVFLKFLEFYGETFDYEKYGLVFTDGFKAELIEKDQLKLDDFQCPSMLTITDPVNICDEQPRPGAHNLLQIRAAFATAANAFRTYLNSDFTQTSVNHVLRAVIPITRGDQMMRKRLLLYIQTHLAHPPVYVLPPFNPNINPYSCPPPFAQAETPSESSSSSVQSESPNGKQIIATDSIVPYHCFSAGANGMARTADFIESAPSKL
ncbi:hypothetical protein M3Y99_00369000 [Aphelenchoides fujianensis]|nr:hypothetical protein M3Y99_00369000 [Aphelenchoides fujianensis]